MENFVDEGKKLGEKLNKEGVSTGQIRKILAAINQINNRLEIDGWDAVKADIEFLRVKVAYQMGRFSQVKKGFEGIDEKIKMAKTDEKEYRAFAQYIEAAVAYHKFYGGKD